MMSITVNGIHYHIGELPQNKRLLDYLRDDLHLKGTKEGCSQGECGACTVIMNGKTICSCLTLLSHVPYGAEIKTIEYEDVLMNEIKESFMKAGATQCGFCTSGFIVSTYALLKEKPNSSLDEIKDSLSGNLCRCTGYTKIYDAVILAQDSLNTK